MFIKNLGKRERILFAACIVLAAMAMIYSLLIDPVVNRWKILNTQISAKKAQLIKNTRLLSMYKTLEAEHAKYQGVVELGTNEEEEQRKALSTIEDVSRKTACHIFNIKPRPSKKLGNYKEISFEVTVGGGIGEISQFLHEIETSREHLRIRQLTITSRLSASEKLKGIFLISKIIFP